MDKNYCDKHEFNSGFVSALAKFMAHAHMFDSVKTEHDIKIYGASDHLIDIVIPSSLSDKLKDRIGSFQNNVFGVRHSLARPKESATELFAECDLILQEIDKEVFNLEHVCSNYE